MGLDSRYFIKFNFTREQVDNNLKNALRDLSIAKKDTILEVKFNYAYSALIKSGIALLSYYHLRVKSIPGHHVKIIEKIASSLDDAAVMDIGNMMRSKRNLDLYAGGIEVTEKECREYIKFAEKVFEEVKKKITEDSI
jgi:HEPN domain-containing protein